MPRILTRTKSLHSVAVASLTLVSLLGPRVAEACGCFHPPVPPPVPLSEEEFAINQKAERILFEVNEEEGTVSAHVSIAYSGAPESFAWLLPVPNIEEVSISTPGIFELLEQATNPTPTVQLTDLCPDPGWQCTYKPDPCPRPMFPTAPDVIQNNQPENNPNADVEVPIIQQSPVSIVFSEIVGDYEVIVFEADEATLTVDWLVENGFLVNETMTPYMQPYLDKGMMFLAAKLVPGAGIESIKPLKMTYRGEHPMIPLQLTAIAADPHMPVYAYIFADKRYNPVDHPVIDLDMEAISNASGKSNYSAVMNRAIDQASNGQTGAFVVEYEGELPPNDFSQFVGCCDEEDRCELADNLLCECPTEQWDAVDCEPTGLVEPIQMYQTLSESRQILTRLVTRLSPEEMAFDPMFEPYVDDGVLPYQPPQVLRGTDYSLDSCGDDVIDQEKYAKLDERSACSATYCGQGECAVNPIDNKPGCLCEYGYVAQAYTDLDGTIAATCAPKQGTVDLAADQDVPSACAAYSCGNTGTCVDVGGFPTCECDEGHPARINTGGRVICESKKATNKSGDTGGRNYTVPLKELEVCAPAAPSSCGELGWLIERETDGVICELSKPDPELLIEPDEPVCEESEIEEKEEKRGRNCEVTPAGTTGLFGPFSLLGLALGSLWLRRRRQAA